MLYKKAEKYCREVGIAMVASNIVVVYATSTANIWQRQIMPRRATFSLSLSTACLGY